MIEHERHHRQRLVVADRERLLRRGRHAVPARHRRRHVDRLVRGIQQTGTTLTIEPGGTEKSPATAGATGAAETVTVTSSLEALLSVAVTVLAPPFSENRSRSQHQRDDRRLSRHP